VKSKGGATQWVYWDAGTARLLPRLLKLPDGTSRTHGPLFLSHRRPVPARRPAAEDICPQLRHSAATHLGDAKTPLHLIMAKTRHRNPRTAMRYVRPGSEAIAEITGILAPPRRTH
jgi:integrase